MAPASAASSTSPGREMRTNLNRSIFLIASLLLAAPAFAQWPGPPSKPSQPSASSPAPAAPARRTSTQEDDGSSGFALGLRAGWAFPIGDLSSTATLGDQIAGQIPVWLEAGWRFNKNLLIGVYGQRGFGLSNNCPIGTSCSTSGWRLGVEGIFNLLPDAAVQPWVGLGVGYEGLSTSPAGASSCSTSRSASTGR